MIARPDPSPSREAGPSSAPRFIVAEMVFLVAAHWLGGPPWAVLGAIAITIQALARPSAVRLLLLLPAAAWLGLSRAVGNRELFFPYGMALAAFAALALARRSSLAAALAGGLVAAAFIIVRILQQATVGVLAVEGIVALAILAFILVGARPARGWPAGEAALVATASLLAYVGLAL